MRSVIKMKGKRYNIVQSVREVAHYTPELPKRDEVFKYISLGGFSAISFILFVASKEKIDHLHVASFRVGKKEIQALDSLKRCEKLDRVTFVLGKIMANDAKMNKRYSYYDDLMAVCSNNNWECKLVNTHAKIYILKTNNNFYVLETSSNLNENPQREQFSFENDKELYDFYLHNFFEVI